MQDTIREITEKAVGQNFDAWAAEHPTLASVIDRVELTQQVVESLRQSDAFRTAVAGYYRSQSEIELLSKLVDLAAPIVLSLLAA